MNRYIMLSNKYSTVLDKIWTGFSLASELKSLAVLDLINTLLFIKQLDETQEEKGKISAISGKPVDDPIYTTDQQDLRWRSFHYLDQQTLFELFYQKNGVLEFAKNLPEYRRLQKFEKTNETFIPPSFLLAETISLINQLHVPDDVTRTEMINYLIQKSEAVKKDFPYVAPTGIQGSPLAVIKPQSGKASRKGKPLSSFYKPLIFLFLGVVAIALFYLNWKRPADKAADIRKPALTEKLKRKDTLSIQAPGIQKNKKDPAKKTPLDKSKKTLPAKDSLGMSNKATNKKVAAEVEAERKEAKVNDPQVDSANKAAKDQPKQNNKNTQTKGQYKILEKAYFHDEPDESTRRNAFLVHWNNSYATLQALEEKNGFIYVVFRNHQNQVSKGWLRKSDLKPID